MTNLEMNTMNAIISMAKRNEPDYWTRLEHQYAGMAMLGMLANQSIVYGQDFNEDLDEHITVNAVAIAHALVEKLKEEDK